jgi:hypothetical protein
MFSLQNRMCVFETKNKVYGQAERSEGEVHHKEMQEVVRMKGHRRELVSYNDIADPVVLISATENMAT